MDLVRRLKGIGNGNVIWFCNYNCNHDSGYRIIGIGTEREYYTFMVLIMEVFVTGILHYFGNDNSKLHMSCSCIRMRLVTHYMVLIMILEGIGNGNVIWFYNYNRNHLSVWIRIRDIIEICFSF